MKGICLSVPDTVDYPLFLRVVEEVLGSLGALETPRIDVYNKVDRPEAKPRTGGIAISATTGDGVPELLAAIETALGKAQVKIDLVVPYDKYDAMQEIRQAGTILSETHEADGTHVTLLMNESETWRVKKALN